MRKPDGMRCHATGSPFLHLVAGAGFIVVSEGEDGNRGEVEQQHQHAFEADVGEAGLFATQQAEEDDAAHHDRQRDEKDVLVGHGLVDRAVPVGGVGEREKEHVETVAADDAAHGERERAPADGGDGGHEFGQRGGNRGHQHADQGAGYRCALDDAGLRDGEAGQRHDQDQSRELPPQATDFASALVFKACVVLYLRFSGLLRQP